MKHLYLIRHAKSSWTNEGMADHERPLNPRGHKQLGPMCKAIRTEGAFAGTIYCSNAVRARQTAEGLVPADSLPSVHIDDTLYTCDRRTLINWLRNRQDASHIALIGHNPALAKLAGYLLRMPPVRFPTCAFMHITLSIQQWHELAHDTGHLQTFLAPRDVSHELFQTAQAKPQAGRRTHTITEVLHQLYQDIRNLESGVILGYDNEFLHRYRIAMRRSRAIVEALCDICEDDGLRQALKTLRKHTRATSNLRDLHVFLANLQEGRLATETHGAAIAPMLKRYLDHRQATEHKTLVKHINGRKYIRDMDDWHKRITARPFGKQVSSIASADIRQALDKQLRRYRTLAKNLSSQSSDDTVHTMRKRLKRIRYVAEIHNTPYRIMLKQIKHHQQLFGTFQDLCMQIAILHRFHDDAATDAVPDTREASETLIARLTDRKTDALAAILAHGILPAKIS